MSTLRIRATWPHGTYHGREWPPAPLRLYQALIAGYRTGRAPDAELDAALVYLETLPPPLIQAPPAVEQAPVAAAVPNNDGDVTFRHWAGGAVTKARASEAALRTIRNRRAWRFHGPVTYTWAADAGIEPHLPALARLANTLTALGQGTDLAWAELGPEPPAGDLTYRPDATGGLSLAVPYPGVFDVLEVRHQALRGRIQGGAVRGVPEPDHRQEAYRGDLDPPARRWALFALEQPDAQRTWSAEPGRLMEVAAMTRHAIHGAALRAGLPQPVIQNLMGHGEGERILIHPLPNTGHLHADGRVRRVLLSAALSLDPAIWRAVILRLRAAELTPPGATEPLAVLVPAGPDDKLIDRYLGQATTWTTATPVVLPGQDRRRGKPRPARALSRLLRHAAIPEALVESATFEPGPRLRGSHPGRAYRLPQHLAGLPTAHLSIRWKVPVPGPLVLGAGAGYGLGVLAHG